MTLKKTLKTSFKDGLMANNSFYLGDYLDLILWLDASDASTIIDTTTPTQVEQWNDKSGNGFTLSQSTSINQPIYDSVNKSLLFNGTFSIISSTDTALLDAFQVANANTVFAVAEFSTSANEFLCLFSSGKDFFNRYNFTRRLTTDRISPSYYNGAAFVGNSIGIINATSVFDRNAVFTSTYDGSNFDQFRVDGTNYTSTAAALDVGSGSGKFSLGVDQADEQFLDGSISEIIVFNRVLSNAEIASIESYLINKWGVSI